MTHPVVAVKCYGFEWMTDLGLDESSAAATMASHGADWALVQNVIDPLPTSGVAQRIPDHYDESRFRDEIRSHGIKVFESTAVFFQPHEVERDETLRPVADDGSPMTMFDWYLGVSPHSQAYLDRRVALMEEVVSTHQPDGVFLSFIRFPGFWEALTVDVPRQDVRDYGFSAGSLARFQADTGIELPDAPTAVQARIVLGDLRSRWTAWKCGVVRDSVQQLVDAANRVRPGTECLINGLPFPRNERGNLSEEIFGQDLGGISTVAEHIEAMVYHQILKQDPERWIPQVVADLRPRVQGTLLPCIQTTPAYGEAPHAEAGRRPELPPEEVVTAIRAIAGTPADGVSVYHWTDVAAEERTGEGLIANALRAYKDGSL